MPDDKFESKLPDWIPKPVHGYFYVLEIEDGNQVPKLKGDYVSVKLRQSDSHSCKLLWRGIKRKLEPKHYMYFLKALEYSYHTVVDGSIPSYERDNEYLGKLIDSCNQLVKIIEGNRLCGANMAVLDGFTYFQQDIVLKNCFVCQSESVTVLGDEDKFVSKSLEFHKGMGDMVFSLNNLSFNAELQIINNSFGEDVGYSDSGNKDAIFCRTLFLATENIIDKPVQIILHSLNILFKAENEKAVSRQVVDYIEKHSK